MICKIVTPDTKFTSSKNNTTTVWKSLAIKSKGNAVFSKKQYGKLSVGTFTLQWKSAFKAAQVNSSLGLKGSLGSRWLCPNLWPSNGEPLLTCVSLSIIYM